MTAIANVLNTQSKRSRIQEEWLRRLAESVSATSRGSITSQALRKQTEDFLQLLGAGGRMGFAEGPAFVVDFSNPDLNPPHWTLTVHPDGSGHFHSEMGKPAPGSQP